MVSMEHPKWFKDEKEGSDRRLCSPIAVMNHDRRDLQSFESSQATQSCLIGKMLHEITNCVSKEVQNIVFPGDSMNFRER
jgi:hypothetical protein